METNSLFAPEETGGISPEEVFEAYFACRRKKRGTHNALAFEADYERKCIRLWREINAGTYKPSRSVVFIVFKPVQREVPAADFRDRMVHHLIARKIEPLLEAEFIDELQYPCGQRHALRHPPGGGICPRTLPGE